MPFKVVNRSPRPTKPHKSYSYDHVSVYSDASSENGTLHTSYSDISSLGCVAEEGYTKYFEDERQRVSKEYDPYAFENVEQGLFYPSSSKRTLPGIVHQLASALGPDNVHQTTEIDTIPCAGVRIPHGPLKGLLAWRLVVRLPSFGECKKDLSKEQIKARRRRVHSVKLLSRHPHQPTHSHSYPGWTRSISPPSTLVQRSYPNLQDTFSVPQAQQKLIALVSNFILDTSIPHSVISRDTLLALGYSLSHFPRLPASSDPPSVTLSIQGIQTRLLIADFGEASRLGVQFLHDAGVSVFFPQNGDGVGPVLYLESPQLLNGVPSTLPGGVPEPKITLQQRVRALLRMSS